MLGGSSSDVGRQVVNLHYLPLRGYTTNLRVTAVYASRPAKDVHDALARLAEEKIVKLTDVLYSRAGAQ